MIDFLKKFCNEFNDLCSEWAKFLANPKDPIDFEYPPMSTNYFLNDKIKKSKDNANGKDIIYFHQFMAIYLLKVAVFTSEK